MDEEERSTQLALLFPLKAGMSALKSSQGPPPTPPPQASTPQLGRPNSRLYLRRRSSMSDLDKLSPAMARLRVNCSGVPGSAPHSPAGSIGDLMNLKRFGGGEGGSSGSIVGRIVPLSTVSPRVSPILPVPEEPMELRPLSCTQRTERLSRLIRQQRGSRPVSTTFSLATVTNHSE